MLTRHGLRPTAQRAAIYSALASTASHPTAEELHHLVSRRHPGLSLATVYNTLDALTRRGLCRKFIDPTQQAAARFDADTREHVHIITDDGHVRDVPPDLGRALLDSLPPDTLDQLERRLGIRVDGVRLELLGKSLGSERC